MDRWRGHICSITFYVTSEFFSFSVSDVQQYMVIVMRNTVLVVMEKQPHRQASSLMQSDQRLSYSLSDTIVSSHSNRNYILCPRSCCGSKM